MFRSFSPTCRLINLLFSSQTTDVIIKVDVDYITHGPVLFVSADCVNIDALLTYTCHTSRQTASEACCIFKYKIKLNEENKPNSHAYIQNSRCYLQRMLIVGTYTRHFGAVVSVPPFGRSPPGLLHSLKANHVTIFCSTNSK